MKELLDDLQIKKWVKKIHQLEVNSLPSNGKLEATYILSDIFYEKMQRLIEQVNLRASRRRFLKKVGIIVAAILLVFSISNSKSIVNAAKNIMEWFETHTSFKFSEDINVKNIHRYNLSYVPDGYIEVMNEYYDGVFGFVLYEREGQEPLSLEYGISDGQINIDNEDVDFRIIEKEGLIIYFFQGISQKENIATWVSEDKTTVFTLVGEQAEEEFLKIIKNIEKE